MVTTPAASISPLQPDICVRKVAYNIRFDSDDLSGGSGTYDAEWMDDRWGGVAPLRIWTSVRKQATTRVEWQSWATEDENTPYKLAYRFFDKLEESVDLGVYYLARAMTRVIQEAGIYKCALGVQDLKKAASKNIMLGMMFMLLSYLGISLVEFFMRSSDSVWLLLYATL